MLFSPKTESSLQRAHAEKGAAVGSPSGQAGRRAEPDPGGRVWQLELMVPHLAIEPESFVCLTQQAEPAATQHDLLGG